MIPRNDVENRYSFNSKSQHSLKKKEMRMQVNRIAVVGAGTMGSSISVALISRAFPVILKDVDENAVQAGLANIDRLLKSRVEKGLPAQEAESQRALVQPATDYSGFADV